ncbi:TIGR03016 family PEP-CTERM system-associated outer membrane protein [Alteromonas genovensis]|uniref:TIGR03016 family PEP-CTERM system-associated outer membrane protein n=2 Tax=Alteromonas genovensis TaxID=471225 RepID=A0A6N9TFG4_9ALTE|nr:TIGR03016 family PEP-CTERM system-associated outer membrane protein [Alteromonas genovensis]
MPKEISNSRLVSSSVNILFSVFILATNLEALAGINVTANASANSVFQDINSEENGTFSFTTLSVNPNVNISYQSRTLNGLWQGKLTHLERDRNDASREDTYGEYSYSANWNPFDELLVFQVSGALNYQNAQAGNFLVSDFLTNSDALAKTRSNRIGVTSTISQGDWIRGTGQASYSDVASERNALNNGFALNNDSYQLSGTLTNGDEAKYLIWNLTGSFQSTDRAQANQGAFISRNASGFVDIHFLPNWAVRVTGTHEGNQVSARNDTSNLVREFDSYGVGITYRQSTNRFISLTANTTNSDLEDDDNETFVGLDAQWALSTRTQISATYGRRFFGETASANISYNSKYFRTAFGYSEDVTNVSRLLANPENLGVFVCPANSLTIASCFQPNSLSYIPNADEQFVQLTTQNLEFNDNVIIRKSSNFQIGYNFSRVTIGMSLRYSEDDALDQDRLTRTYSLGSTLVYRLGSYTNINASVNYADIAQRSETIEGGNSENWNASLGLERAFGRALAATLDLNYIDRSGDLINGGGGGNGAFGANYTDRRLTLGITYTFD